MWILIIWKTLQCLWASLLNGSFGTCFHFFSVNFSTLIYSLQEKHVKDKQIQHWKNVISLQDKLKTQLAEISNVKTNIKQLHKEIKEAKEAFEKTATRDVSELFKIKSKTYELGNLFKNLDGLEKQLEDSEKNLHDMENSPPR